VQSFTSQESKAWKEEEIQPEGRRGWV